nr:hypothetical protein HEP84_05365 [Streptomyces sp. RLB1-33]
MVAEFVLTGGVLFVVVTAVRWVTASPLSRALPKPYLQLAVVAVMVGAALAGALSSPWGRYSGGHLNPAVTLGLWLTGAFPGRRVPAYFAAQLTGSVAGTGLARLVWGPVLGDRMAYAAVEPAPSCSPTLLFTVEAVSTAAVLTVTLVLMSCRAWTRWIPALSGGTRHHRWDRPVPGISPSPSCEERRRTVAREAIGESKGLRRHRGQWLKDGGSSSPVWSAAAAIIGGWLALEARMLSTSAMTIRISPDWGWRFCPSRRCVSGCCRLSRRRPVVRTSIS